jgi:hypothetical protein
MALRLFSYPSIKYATVFVIALLPALCQRLLPYYSVRWSIVNNRCCIFIDIVISDTLSGYGIFYSIYNSLVSNSLER